MTASRKAPARWLTVRDAPAILSVRPETLRRSLERHARAVSDGGTEAHIDGLRARKFARHWRVMLGEAWQPSEPPTRPDAT
jgi:hypothetical protein